MCPLCWRKAVTVLDKAPPESQGKQNLDQTCPFRYTLLLFRQTGRISAPAALAGRRTKFNVTAFAAQYDLGLPVALNWFTSQPDADFPGGTAPQ